MLAVPVLYVLSYGPFWGLFGRGTIPNPQPNWLFDFYVPMLWLYEETPLQEPLRLYIGWWIDILAKP